MRRGERMTTGQQRAWDSMKDSVLIDVPRHHASTSILPGAEIDVPGAFDDPSAPLTVEIGSGLGEATAFAAAAHPERNFLAVEVYTPGLAKLMEAIADQGLTNVRCMQANAPEVLDIALKPGQVDELWVYFSDPWHKKRHHKRRMIKHGFGATVGRALRDGGLLRLATDWEDYALQMREVMDDAPEFERAFDGDWAERYEGRAMTAFERKGIEKGREIRDLTYRRVPRG